MTADGDGFGPDPGVELLWSSRCLDVICFDIRPSAVFKPFPDICGLLLWVARHCDCSYENAPSSIRFDVLCDVLNESLYLFRIVKVVFRIWESRVSYGRGTYVCVPGTTVYF